MFFFSIDIKELLFMFGLCIVSGYLLGSISFSVVFTRLFKKQDIRNSGSGNAGFTNVLRCAGVLPSVLTLICDLLKTIVAIFLAVYFFSIFIPIQSGMYTLLVCCKYISGISCILGHIFPCFFGFRGGKGVVTTAGTILMIDFRVFICTVIVFIIVILMKKIVSLGSIISAFSLPVFTFAFTFFADYMGILRSIDVSWQYVVLSVVFSCVISAIVILKHKSNIIRLKNGEEKKISIGK